MTNSLPIPKGGRRKTRRRVYKTTPAKFTLKSRRRAQFSLNRRRKV